MSRTVQLAGAAARGVLVFGREARARRHVPSVGDRMAGALGATLVDVGTRLGATFIKVGQIASTRSDLLPRPLVDEHGRLRDQVPPAGETPVQRGVADPGPAGDLVQRGVQTLFREDLARGGEQGRAISAGIRTQPGGHAPQNTTFRRESRRTVLPSPRS